MLLQQQHEKILLAQQQQRQRRNAGQGSVYFDTRDKIWRVQYKKDYYGSYKTEKEAREVLAKLNTLTPEELAKEKERLAEKEKNRRRDKRNRKLVNELNAVAARRNKNMEADASRKASIAIDPFHDVVREYDKLKAEIIKRQDELSEMRSNLKSLGDKKRKFEIEEEERV